MKHVLAFVADNKSALVVFAVIIAYIFIALGCQSSIRRWVKVDVPPEVQRATGVGDRVSLSDVDRIIERYVSAGAQFLDNKAEAESFASGIESLADIGLQSAEIYGQVVPYGGAVTTILGVLGGLLIQKPGTAKNAEKERKKGFKDGVSAARSAESQLRGIIFGKGKKQ